MKQKTSNATAAALMSRPARGAWIETVPPTSAWLWATSRPARGAWIETRLLVFGLKVCRRRAPRGARGLKLQSRVVLRFRDAVAPRAGRVD